MAYHKSQRRNLKPTTIRQYHYAVSRLLNACPPNLLIQVMKMIRAGAKTYPVSKIQSFMAGSGFYMYSREINKAINAMQWGLCPPQYRISKNNRWYLDTFPQEPGPVAYAAMETVSINHPITAPTLQPAMNIV